MVKEIMGGLQSLPFKFKLAVFGGSLGLLIAFFVTIGITGYFVIDAIQERVSHSKTKKELEAAQEKIKAATVERDIARQDAAEAKGREIEIIKQINSINEKAEKSEVKLVTAKKDSKEAKVNYENKTKQTTINDNRPTNVKRDELRARLEKRGITVKE